MNATPQTANDTSRVQSATAWIERQVEEDRITLNDAAAEVAAHLVQMDGLPIWTEGDETGVPFENVGNLIDVLAEQFTGPLTLDCVTVYGVYSEPDGPPKEAPGLVLVGEHEAVEISEEGPVTVSVFASPLDGFTECPRFFNAAR